MLKKWLTKVLSGFPPRKLEDVPEEGCSLDSGVGVARGPGWKPQDKAKGLVPSNFLKGIALKLFLLKMPVRSS